MKTLKIVTIMFLFAFGLLNTVAAAKPASVMLREGLYAEEVEGDIDAAIKIYEQIVKDKSASRDNVAQALYRQGMCCLKKKDDVGARAAFGKLSAEYADQTEIIGKVKPLLDDLMNYDTAALMPPETLVYVEIGSPGEQIETILNMLKGTPFENPLAAVGGGNVAGQGGGQKSPADIVAALLNPSMMAEFKKIKGMAVGVTGITQNNNPPSIAVLYPGKSDALRGLIMMGLSMAGTPGESLEGMQTLNIQNTAAAAYDDKVILIAQPASQLQWCVRQYKGIASGPTLASNNKSFAKISKKQRQNNALTVWANVDEVYAQILKTAQNPQGLLRANAIADFNSIDEFIMTVSIGPNSLASKADVLFKDGHHCLAYDMIRTPNISRDSLEAVPSEAIALASIALSQSNGVQADKVRTKIQNIIGLDIGREIYANIEQVTIFAMPIDNNSASGDFFPPGCLGLAITSHNPDQTRQIFATLLGAVNTMSGNQPSGPVDANAGKFRVDMNGGKEIYCYMDQVNNTTILSLNRGIIDTSIAAVKSKKNVCTAGSLAPAVRNLSPSTSKLVLVNVGGAIHLAGSAMNLGPLNDEQRSQFNASMEQLARAADRTTIGIRTDEQVNSFSLNAAVTGLPPLNEVFGPVTEISRVMSGAKGKAAAVASAITITLDKAYKAPTIDGTVDDSWSGIQKHSIANILYSSVSSPNDLSADYRTMYDQENLYLLVDVRDDVLKNDSAEHYNDDAVEVFIDADNSKSSEYDENDHSYYFKWDKTNPTMGDRGQPYLKGDIKYALVTTDNGYRLEVAFPWVTLGTKPFPGAKIGLDVHVNDDDDGGERDTKITWSDKQDNAWQNPQVFGTAELAGLIGWWKFDESEGTTAADSSGNGDDGSLQGNPVWRPQGGKIGGALEFDGDGDYVKIGNESRFDITNQITISAWVNIASVPVDWTAIVTKGDSAWRLSTEYSNRGFHFAVSGSAWLNGQRSVSANQWHHVVCVYDGSQMRTYVDGELDVAKAWNQGIASNDYPVYIGENAEQTGRFWHGLIDDVRIYNYALKEADIMALYNEGIKK